MDLSMYKCLDTETWINRIYKAHGIFYPEELEIDIVSEIFKIDIHFYPGPSVADYPEGEQPVIFLNAFENEKNRRADFFHELCHPLKHVGIQEEMTQQFEQLQEFQASQFQLYAALPIYMVEPFINECYTYATLEKTLAESFRLPENLVRRRVDQIHNRVYLYKQDLEWERRRAEARDRMTEESFQLFLEENTRRCRERSGA